MSLAFILIYIATLIIAMLSGWAARDIYGVKIETKHIKLGMDLGRTIQEKISNNELSEDDEIRLEYSRRDVMKSTTNNKVKIILTTNKK